MNYSEIPWALSEVKPSTLVTLADHVKTCWQCAHQQPCGYVERRREEFQVWAALLKSKIERGEV